MYSIHCTKKLLDRVKPSIITSDLKSSSRLGNWYATALFWKPQLALLVNEHTLLPVLMPLAPASGLATRFPEYLARVLTAHGAPQSFIDHELTQMTQVRYAKTANRSVVGVMNQFSFLAEIHRDHFSETDPMLLSLKLSETPCSPLYKTSVTPMKALKLFCRE